MNKFATTGRISRKQTKTDMESHACFEEQGNLALDLLYGKKVSSTKTLLHYELHG